MSQPIDVNLGRVNEASRPRDEGGNSSQNEDERNITVTISLDEGKKSSPRQKMTSQKKKPKQKEYKSGNYSRPIPSNEEKDSEHIPIPGRNFDLFR